MRFILTFILLHVLLATHAQTEVLTLGTFHFHFPNLDAQKIAPSDQIDVLDARYQNEIKDIVARIYLFKPTIIVIEREPSEQSNIDSLYHKYLQNAYPLPRSEDKQIGFRLAKMLGLQTLYCVDEWGNFHENIRDMVMGKDTAASRKFENFYTHNPDSLKYFHPQPIYKTEGILPALRQLNDEAHIQKSLGNYLIGLFTYESTPHDFKGVDFETGRWFNRNLKIFRNIQRIATHKDDKILVIFGADHLNLLNYFFECSPEYRLVHANDYLQ